MGLDRVLGQRAWGLNLCLRSTGVCLLPIITSFLYEGLLKAKLVYLDRSGLQWGKNKLLVHAIYVDIGSGFGTSIHLSRLNKWLRSIYTWDFND